MKKLLSTTAIAGSLVVAGAAANATDTSLLESILAKTTATQASLLNIAENLATVDASVTIDGLDAKDMATLLQLFSVDIDGGLVGMLSNVVYKVETTSEFDENDKLVGESTVTALTGQFYDPANLFKSFATTVKGVETTAIGALNTGIVGNQTVGAQSLLGTNADGPVVGSGGSSITANVMNLMNTREQSVAMSGTSLASSTTYAKVDPIQIANLAFNNSASLDASVTISSLLASVDGLSTTAIGALNTGNIAMDIATNTASATQAIVGN